MLSQCCLELGGSRKRASSRQSLLLGSCLVWPGLGLHKPRFVASSLLVPIVSSWPVLPWFPFAECGVSCWDWLLGVALGPVAVRGLGLPQGLAGGSGPGRSWTGSLFGSAANGTETSCGCGNGDWAGLRMSSASVTDPCGEPGAMEGRYVMGPEPEG